MSSRRKTFACLAALAALGLVAAPMSLGRLTFENFVSEASDGVAGVYFSKVWEPGTQNGGGPAYSVVGCVYPVRQAVDASRSGGLPEKWPVQYGWATAHDVVPLPAARGTVVRLADK